MSKYRLVTRSDFDGLVCAALLKELDIIDKILFVHPKDMQDGKIKINSNDIITNLPYVEGCYLTFDHHESEIIRNKDKKFENYIIDPYSPSAARLVYNYYGGESNFPNISKDMMEAVDKADFAQFTIDDVLMPKGWELLSFIMDSRTGLGRFKEFRISNYQLMMNLIDACRKMTIDDILNLPDVKERVEIYFEYQDLAEEQIKRCSQIVSNIVILDLREEEIIYPTNRFTIYGLYPQCNVSIHRMWGLDKKVNVFAVGKSIFNRTCESDIGLLMLKYGGGGHSSAGTCQIGNEKSDEILNEIINQLLQYN
ncbi:MAG: exopolyphosphatase [Candidatus Sericytochromatia bacterium]|nr:MAG: exopolyphosphatase [Candidatus Sericytochromatia bacterium]